MTTMYVVRHGPKTHGNGYRHAKHPDDPALTQSGHQLAVQRGSILGGAYPPPVKVYVSPFLRTRQTAADLLFGWGLNIPVEVDVRLSETFGERKHSNKLPPSYGNMTWETARYWPPMSETGADVRNRIESFLADIRSRNEGPVLVVTHGLVLTNFGRGIEYPKELTGVELSADGSWRPLV